MPSEGDIIVAQLPQADGSAKHRPALLLRSLPGYGDFLACGISSQIQQAVDGFDVILRDEEAGFSESGLSVASVIRLTFLAAIPRVRMKRRLGKVSEPVLRMLQSRLAKHLVADH